MTEPRLVPLVIDQPNLPGDHVGLLQVRQLVEESGAPGRPVPGSDVWIATITATMYVLRGLPADTLARLDTWAQDKLERLLGDDEGEPDPWATHRVGGALLLQLPATEHYLPEV